MNIGILSNDFYDTFNYYNYTYISKDFIEYTTIHSNFDFKLDNKYAKMQQQIICNEYTIIDFFLPW